MEDLKDLIFEIAKGDKDAFHKFYNLTVTELRFYIQWKLKSDKSQLEDIMQTVYFKVWEKADTYKGVFPPKPWLFKIARNVVIDFFRENKRHKDAEEIYSLTHAEDYTPPEESPCVEGSLKTLTEDEFKVVKLKAENYDTDEISKITGFNKTKIYNVFRSAKKKITKYWSENKKKA